MNDFYILLAQFFSTCLLQYFYICLGKIKQTSNPQLSSSASFLRLNVLSSLN